MTMEPCSSCIRWKIYRQCGSGCVCLLPYLRQSKQQLVASCVRSLFFHFFASCFFVSHYIVYFFYCYIWIGRCVMIHFHASKPIVPSRSCQFWVQVWACVFAGVFISKIETVQPSRLLVLSHYGPQHHKLHNANRWSSRDPLCAYYNRTILQMESVWPNPCVVVNVLPT